MKRKLDSSKSFDGWVSRETTIDPIRKKNEDGSYPTIITTEAPAMVIDWSRFDIVREILLMSGVDIPDSKQVPLLDAHSRFSNSDVLGSERNIRVEGDKLIGDTFIWSGAKEIQSKIDEHHLTDVSAGYRTFDNFTTIVKPGQTAIVYGKTFTNNFGDDKDLLIRTKWSIKETSVVPIGADSAAKFRAEGKAGITSLDPELQKKLNDAFEIITNQKTEIEKLNNSIKINERGATMPEGTIPTPEEITRAERERLAEIQSTADRFAGNYKGDMKSISQTAIKDGWDINKFRNHILDNFDSTKPVETSLGSIGASKSDFDKYSLARAFNSLSEGKFGGVEKEMSDAISAKIGRSPRDGRSFFVPEEYWRNFQAKQLATRALTTASGSGTPLIATENLVSSFIEMLRPKSALLRAGVTTITGLKDNVTIPKQSGAGNFQMVGDANAATEGDLALSQIASSPKVGSAWQSFSKLLLAQSNPSVETTVVNDLLLIGALGLDQHGINGVGTGYDTTGLLNQTGVGSVSGVSASWNTITQFENLIETANADLGSIQWMTNPAVKQLLKTRPKMGATSPFPEFLMGADNSMNGYPSIISTLVPSATLIMGVFNQMVLLEWGLTEITVDPYSQSKQGLVNVILFTYFDWVCRNAVAFAASTTMA